MIRLLCQLVKFETQKSLTQCTHSAAERGRCKPLGTAARKPEARDGEGAKEGDIGASRLAKSALRWQDIRLTDSAQIRILWCVKT